MIFVERKFNLIADIFYFIANAVCFYAEKFSLDAVSFDINGEFEDCIYALLLKFNSYAV